MIRNVLTAKRTLAWNVFLPQIPGIWKCFLYIIKIVVGGTDAHVGIVLLALLVHQLQSLWMEKIIGIPKCKIFAGCHGHSVIAGSSGVLVLLPEEAYPGIFCFIFFQNLWTFIGGTVIHTDDLDVF